MYLQNRNGRYTQIDVALATKVGIIVFEVKDYSGWIFGGDNQYNWTQVLAYGKEKHRFYNPILQNQRHIENLKTKLTDFQKIPFHSVVVFYGDCTFKNIEVNAKNTYLVKSYEVIKTVQKIVSESAPAQYKSKRDVINVLSAAVRNGESAKIRNKHAQDIRDMLVQRRNVASKFW